MFATLLRLPLRSRVRLAVGVITAGLPLSGWGDCPCRTQGLPVSTQTASDQFVHPEMIVAPQDTYLPQPAPQPGMLTPVPSSTPVGVGPLVNRYAVSPPPGTLGQTYQRRSGLMPDEERAKSHSIERHPRAGGVDVYLPEDVDVTARGMTPRWTGKVWRLETKDPLIPGVPHIYAIKAERRNKQGEVISTDVRWVRLIMGRVVDLEF